METRRVITGHDSNGKSVFVTDDRPAAATPNLQRLWASDETPTYPNDGRSPDVPGFFPASPEAIRVWFITHPPESAGGQVTSHEITPQALLQLQGAGDVQEHDEPGMHTTDTIDFDVVISGQLTLELDNGAERTVGPGELIVQNGTRHRWHNRGTETVTMASIVIGANRKS